MCQGILKMRAVGRDLIRGGHYGQRSREPHLKAEHMAAPTNAAKREKSSCQSGAVHTWHLADIASGPKVRSAPIAATCRTATKKALKRWHALRLGTFLCHESQSRRL